MGDVNEWVLLLLGRVGKLSLVVVLLGFPLPCLLQVLMRIDYSPESLSYAKVSELYFFLLYIILPLNSLASYFREIKFGESKFPSCACLDWRDQVSFPPSRTINESRTINLIPATEN